MKTCGMDAVAVDFGGYGDLNIPDQIKEYSFNWLI